MMNLEDRIQVFTQLGLHLNQLDEESFDEVALNAAHDNSWFTKNNVRSSINGISKFLNQETLVNWVDTYKLPQHSKKVGIVMAGNIPLVGFHDLLSVVMSGHQAKIKTSSQDRYLVNYILATLKQLDERITEHVTLVDQLKDVDAIIATGSDNTARYFEYYFAKYPHIIRKNRTSVGILDGNEDKSELEALGNDIFQYYGLGCRNVSKIFVPRGFTFDPFFEALETFSSIKDHHKYSNNYDYNKSIYLVNGDAHLDNGFLLVKPSEQLVSPIAVLFYAYYDSESDLNETLTQQQDKIQCIVSKGGKWPGSFPFGYAQQPEITDYADNVDTMEFLCRLD